MTNSKTITVQQGLTELKTLEARINKKIYEMYAIGVGVKGKVVHPIRSLKDVKEFEEKSKTDMQSIEDLISYRSALKSSVMRSNGMTMLKVGEIEMTVAEAIERKNSIELQRHYIGALKKQLQATEVEIVRYNNKIDETLNKQIETLLGSDKEQKNEKLVESLRENTKEDYATFCGNKSQKELSELITKSEEEIEDFEANVDLALTTSNVLTNITFEW